MGRQPGYDTAALVRAARRVFWEHGYEQASVPELERATGVNRSSLYHAFGSKRGLYDAALTSYLDEVVRPRLRPLQTPPVQPAALADYLQHLLDALARDATGDGDASRGCLLLSAAAAPIGQDDAVRAVVVAYRAELRAAVAGGLAAARPDLDDTVRAHLAESVTALVVAALALVRVDVVAAADSLRAALEVSRPEPARQPARQSLG
ncbi:transcriptional regulator, TetR family [Quadrisphaera granulorum]|uniref:TetR family transcriptional regulator n=1 Tax=Quadrisphaera granulorum TaxID=317664 RepID=A0A316AAI1_9ACTN|nr:TetR/AcrR family transcriptional regulator [Quadrisphaera granulorum]PWJ54693.1 TetR family transcriptional regulator [Quadrisphaera granulorum]SZE96055.1 transcriptional regulator, TetR family [Quadrisphaera granulorum]